MSEPNDIMDIPQSEPCPFCGSIRARRIDLTEHRLTHSSGTLYARFGCDSCGASVFGQGHTSEEAWTDAEAKWNKRESKAKWLTSGFIRNRFTYNCSNCGKFSRLKLDKCPACRYEMTNASAKEVNP